jgi:hypothetical protein
MISIAFTKAVVWKGQDQGQPFPMGVNSEKKGGRRSQENKPPEASILFCLLHVEKF